MLLPEPHPGLPSVSLLSYLSLTSLLPKGGPPPPPIMAVFEHSCPPAPPPAINIPNLPPAQRPPSTVSGGHGLTPWRHALTPSRQDWQADLRSRHPMPVTSHNSHPGCPPLPPRPPLYKTCARHVQDVHKPCTRSRACYWLPHGYSTSCTCLAHVLYMGGLRGRLNWRRARMAWHTP